ncbi:MAG TPA: MFS transporter [Stellaceae bacterium]|nr:MFS transporter [Stellaceae bacterium]
MPPDAASPPIITTEADWSRTLWVMVGIQFVMTLSFTVLSPIMPLFLPELGVKAPAAIDLWTGILNGTTPLVAAFMSPLWGRLADRRGRKLMLIRSGIAIVVFTALMGISTNIWEFLAFRILLGTFAGFSASAITLVASQVPERRLGYALGWLATGQLVGGLAGPIVGGLAADIAGSYRVPFFLTACVAAVSVVLAQLLVKEKFTPPKLGEGRNSILAGMRMLVGSAGVLPLFAVLLLAQFGVRTVQPVITLYVQELVGNVANLATLSGLAFSMTGLADVIASPFLGKRSDILGYRRVLVISLCGAALFSLPQAFVSNYWAFVALRFGVGMFVGGILPTANALVGRMVAASDRGMLYGLTATATFLGNSLGPVTGGAVAASIGLRWVFLVTAGALFANLAWVLVAVPSSVDRIAEVTVGPPGQESKH